MKKLTTKQKINGVLILLGLLLLGNSYVKWEFLTAQKGQEVEKLLKDNSNEWMLPPEFFKVVEYNDQRIVAFMVETGGQDMLVEFKKIHRETGNFLVAPGVQLPMERLAAFSLGTL